jgi:hypothetical protein
MIANRAPTAAKTNREAAIPPPTFLVRVQLGECGPHANQMPSTASPRATSSTEASSAVLGRKRNSQTRVVPATMTPRTPTTVRSTPRTVTATGQANQTLPLPAVGAHSPVLWRCNDQWVIGDEARVVDAFCSWLKAQGWTTQREVAFVDIAASRGDQRLYAEAKGRTSAVGLDVDTLYGQLLRRMPAEKLGQAIFAVVVPDVAVKAAERGPVRIREVLGIEIYGVGEDGSVTHVGDHLDPLTQQ